MVIVGCMLMRTGSVLFFHNVEEIRKNQLEDILKRAWSKKQDIRLNVIF
jgi:hypothetical protein